MISGRARGSCLAVCWTATILAAGVWSASAIARFAVQDGASTATVRGSFEENRHIRPDSRVPKKNPPRVTFDITQTVDPALVAPGAKVQVTWTRIVRIPAVNYTSKGKRCRKNFETGFAGKSFRYRTEFGEEPKDVHVFPAASPSTLPPFDSTSDKVDARKVSEHDYGVSTKKCAGEFKFTDTHEFTAPTTPGIYAVSWGEPRVSAVKRFNLATGRANAVPLARLKYEISGELPSLTVQG